MHLDGLVVVRRWANAKRPAGRRTAKDAGWTLHRDTCLYVKRTKRGLMPAPVNPYAGTVACKICKPEVKEGIDGNE